MRDELYVMDRALARLERQRLNPPDINDEDDSTQFVALSDDDQRTEIRDWLRSNPEHDGLIGEAINESSYALPIRAALLANDPSQLGRLIDGAVREYLGAVIQREWDAV